ncbi:hypothetical protein [Paludibaculum fermentans]|uniref:hypothetical protein n=1 Tax=Paludibaculum fermentans TaxID=1473598 RepID=UPI003EBB8813
MKSALLVSLVLYGAACCLPALALRKTGSPDDIMLGLRALAVGWSGIFAGVLGWYANPVWLLGLVLGALRKPTAAAIAGVLAVAIACTVFSDLGRELPGDEGNITKTAILRVLPGFYVWLASFLVLPVAAFLQRGK